MPVAQHADREHALWSASATAGNWACSGRLALTMNLPDRTSEAADWGTCAHQISERCLRDGGDADRFIGTTEKGKVHSFEVDEEMADTAQMYVDYVRKVTDAAESPAAEGMVIVDSPFRWIEQRFTLADLKPPFDAGGTGDAVIYLPAEKRLEVVDLKGGRGVVVEAGKNPQLRTYALGALLANKGLKVDSVTVTIVQPRAPHPGGRIRSETIDVMDLLEWTVDLLAAMNRSKQALDAKADMAEAAWAAAFLTPGAHCGSTFCKAAATCPALNQSVMDLFQAVETDTGWRMSNAADQTDPDERSKRLDLLDMAETWIKEVRAHEHRLAELGQPASGYGLVQKQGREKWNDGIEDQVKLACELAGLPTDKFLTPGKLRTPKQVRDALKKSAADVAGLSSTPVSGTNLVRLDKSSRPEVAPITNMFSPVQ